MKYFTLWISLISLVAYNLALTLNEVANKNGIYMIVNDEPVTYYTIYQSYLMRTYNAKINSAEQQSNQVNSAVEDAILYTLKQQELKKFKFMESITIDPLDAIAESSKRSKEVIIQELQRRNIDIDLYKSIELTNLKWKQFIFQFSDRFNPVETKALIDKIKSLPIDVEEGFIIAEIGVNFNPKDSKASGKASDLIYEAFDKIRSTGNFQAVANEYSQLPSAVKGGIKGFVPRRNLDKEILGIFETAIAGQLIPPIKHKNGYYIYVVIQAVDPKKQKEELSKIESINNLPDNLIQQAKFELFQNSEDNYLLKIRRSANIIIK